MTSMQRLEAGLLDPEMTPMFVADIFTNISAIVRPQLHANVELRELIDESVRVLPLTLPLTMPRAMLLAMPLDLTRRNPTLRSGARAGGLRRQDFSADTHEHRAKCYKAHA